MKQAFQFLLLTSISLFSITLLPAQTQVQGRIVDAQGEPLALANILLLTATDSSFVKGAIADEQGTFRLSNLKQGAYRCQISMVGYPSVHSPSFQITAQPGEIALGDIILRHRN